MSETLSVGLVGVVAFVVVRGGAVGLVGEGALNLLTGGVGAFCTNCFSFAFFSSSAAFLKNAMRSFTEPIPPPLAPGRPNLGGSYTSEKIDN